MVGMSIFINEDFAIHCVLIGSVRNGTHTLKAEVDEGIVGGGFHK